MENQDDVADHEALAGAIAGSLGLRLGGLVGSGAFKYTFLVLTPDGTSKALKVYKSLANARTEREVDAIRRCSHPGIAHFETLDTWANEGRRALFSLEEFLDGGTLAARLATGLLMPEELRAYATQLVDSLAHLAGLGLVHRDIKPDNIMFRGDRQVVLVDLGLVRDLSKSSLTQTWAPNGPGTPYYSSPEQLNNDKTLIDWRSDQFSLGLVLGEAGYGSHPFLPAGSEHWMAVEAVARREAPTPEFAEWATSVHPSILRMLAAWPVGRFRTPALLRRSWAPEEG